MFQQRIAKLWLLLSVSLGQVSTSASELRTWQSANGKFTIRAELIEVSGNSVSLKREDGKIVDVPLSKLSKADQSYVTDRADVRQTDTSSKFRSERQAASNPARNSRGSKPSNIGDYVEFSAVGVSLRRPKGFVRSQNFEGLEQESTLSAVMITLIPGPYAGVTQGFTAAGFQSQGMTLKRSEEIQVEGKQGLLLAATQELNGTEFNKWMLAIGDERETYLVVASFPGSADAELSRKLKEVVMSTKLTSLKSKTPVEIAADLGFTFSPSRKLKPTRGLGKMIMLTKGGVIPAKSPTDPVFIIAPSLSAPPIPDKPSFALQRLYQTATTKINSVTSSEPLMVAGLAGFELIADAENVKSGAAIQVYQTILFKDEGYILIQGLVGADLADEYMPEFRAMVRSIELK